MIRYKKLAIFENKRYEKHSRNEGIELLRVLLCFWVIVFHYLKNSNQTIIFIKSKKYHVPCFFFISFYFLYPIIRTKNIDKMKLRLERLLIPYIIWPIIILVLYDSLYLIFRTNEFNRIINLYDLKIQIIVGRRYMAHLWFIFNLLFYSIFFFIICFLVKTESFVFCLQVFSLISYLFQYSRFNYFYFDKFKMSIRLSIGYFVETMPFASSAFLLSSADILEKLIKHRMKIYIISFILIYLIIKYNVFNDLVGYTYRGIENNLASLIIFILFLLIPFEYLKSKVFKSFFLIFSKFTQGIYCLHILVIYIISLVINKKYGNLIHCFIVYFFGYIISFFFSKIFGKNKLRYLF